MRKSEQTPQLRGRGRSEGRGPVGRASVGTVAWALACAGLGLASEAAAKCAASTPPSVLTPTDVELPTNAQLIVEKFDMKPGLGAKLEASPPSLIAQAAPGERAPLRVVAHHLGGMRIEQVILAPVQPLKPGTRYQLKLPAGGDTVSFRVGARPDRTPPVWSGSARPAGSHFQALGCGPAIDVTLQVPVSDDGPAVFVRATAKGPAATDAPQIFVVPVHKGQISLGHGMCSGSFALSPGVRYEVQLTAVDLAGNEAPAPGEPLVVHGPSPSKREGGGGELEH